MPNRLLLMFFKVVFLSVLEGVTEFLPVSSTGHLLLVSPLLGLNPAFYEVFDIVIQLGAILAVVSLYPRYFFNMIRSPIQKDTGIMAMAILPILVIGFLFKDVIKGVLFNPLVIFGGLIVGGLGLILVDQLVKDVPAKANITFKQGIWIGLWQCLALIPGMSRSAMTMMGGVVAGCDRVSSARFSFVIAVPLMVIISGYELWSVHRLFTPEMYAWVLLGCGVSYVVARLTMQWFLGIIQKNGLTLFGVYRIVLGCVGLWVLI